MENAIKRYQEIRTGRHCIFNLHVHLVFVTKYRQKIFTKQTQISKMVNSLKGVSSRMLKKQHPEITRWYYKKQSLWSPSYFAASCGGAPIAIVQQYIQQQKTPK